MLLHGPSVSIFRVLKSGMTIDNDYPRWIKVKCDFKYDIEAPLPSDIVFSMLKMKVKELKRHPELRSFKIIINKDVLLAALDLPPFEVNGRTLTGIFPNLKSGVDPDNALLWIQHTLCTKARTLLHSKEANGKSPLLLLDKPIYLTNAVSSSIAQFYNHHDSVDAAKNQNSYHLQQVLGNQFVLNRETIEQLMPRFMSGIMA